MGKARYLVRLTKGTNGDWTAAVPDLPRCSAKGRTVETALRRIQVVIRLESDKLRAKGQQLPRPRRSPPPGAQGQGPFDFYAVVVVDG